MKKQIALKTIFGISIAGLLFSGYLSFTELIQKTCAVGSCDNLLGLPVCVYGFIMYFAVFIITILGMQSKK